MDLIVLGAGTSFPLSYLASPSLALYVNDRCTLFDVGPGSIRQLARIGINHDRIDKVFITHFHPDHTADLIHLLFVTRNPSVLKNRRPFSIIGPKGLNDLIKNLQDTYPGWLDIPSGILSIQEIDYTNLGKIDFGDFSIVARPVKHTHQSLAYRIENRSGHSFVYSGDTEFCEGIVELANHCDLLILECSFPDGHEIDGHLTPSQAGRIATLCNTKKLMLIHFYPEVLSRNIAEECRKSYNGELVLARDLLKITV